MNIKIELEQFSPDKSYKKGDLFYWEGGVYKFDGYDFGTYPMAENIETGEQKQLPQY